MKVIKTRKGLEILVDAEDYPYLSQFRWSVICDGKYAARNKTGGGTILMHRELLDAGPGEQIDHINRNGLDNRRCNIRFANDELNNRNRNKNRTNKSGRPGIIKHGDRWRAFISTGPRTESKQIHLGVFDTFEEAVASRKTAEKLLWGEEWRATGTEPLPEPVTVN
jgi:hypothetical protein